MKEENYNEEFLAFIEQKSIYSFGTYLKEAIAFIEEDRFFLVSDLTITNKEIIQLSLHNIHFRNCKFIGVSFGNTYNRYLSYEKCHFIECNFYSAEILKSYFIECHFTNTKFTSVEIITTTFENSLFESYEDTDKNIPNGYTFFSSKLEDTSFVNVRFTNIALAYVYFTQRRHIQEYALVIEKTTFSDISFISINLRDTKMIDSHLFSTSFTDCVISKNTFSNIGHDKDKQNKNFIDLQTILKSELSHNDFKMFGIQNADAKQYISDLVTEHKFHSVFISYSFKDKEFARALSHVLMTKGVKSFFWERDAPGGKTLKKIMADNIHKLDKILFIASKNSLKSEACHFELKEGREKYKKEWKDIYFPIHIDDFLFTIDKETIPTEFQEEFWKNIQELKRYNSKDFSIYKNEEDFRSPDFETAIKQLIKDLRLE